MECGLKLEFFRFFPYPIEFYKFYTESQDQTESSSHSLYFLSGFSAKLVHTIVINSGFELTNDLSKATLIIGSKSDEDTQKYLLSYQKMTHYLFTHVIGRKIGLHITLSQFMHRINRRLSFYPLTFLLPDQMDQFKQKFMSSKYWIEKPSSGSCGRGIQIIDKIPEKLISPKVVMQEYISNPLLINGFKFDLRFYVAVTSLDPLRIYNYEDGLVRLATDNYCDNFNDISKLSAHLTNFSINKDNTNNFHVTNDLKDDGCGSKWSHMPFWPFMESLNYEPEVVKDMIDTAIATVLIAARESLLKQKNHRSSFELYGFDVMITVDGEIHILEVNISPALGTSSELDRHIKTPLVKDLFNVALVPDLTDDDSDGGIGAQRNKTKKKKEIFDRIEASFENMEKLKDVAEFACVCEFEIAENRKGAFRRVYPTVERVNKLGNLMQNKTDLDKVLENWIKMNDSAKNLFLQSKMASLRDQIGDLVEIPKESCLLI